THAGTSAGFARALRRPCGRSAYRAASGPGLPCYTDCFTYGTAAHASRQGNVSSSGSILAGVRGGGGWRDAALAHVYHGGPHAFLHGRHADGHGNVVGHGVDPGRCIVGGVRPYATL